ncbi:MAG: glycosyltransferase family 4 protein [Bacteroidetes bacterium]|nr:glycosyltransferase family 4 protein [Bacteroidota bacterium]
MKTPAPPNTFLINGRFLTQQLSGVQSFARSICRELSASAQLVILVPENEKLTNDEFSDLIVRFGKFKGPIWEQLDLPRYVKKQKGLTLINLCNTGPLFLKNQAVTIHDLAFKKNPKWFHPLFSAYYNFLIPQICRNSKIVFTVSNTIKGELVAQLGIAAEKIAIVANKVSEVLLQMDPQKPNGLKANPKEFFLMVGTQDPRKNFAFVEELFKEGFEGKKLIIAGGSNRNFNSSVTENSQSDFVLKTGFITEAELKWLYLNAIALINPSLYEGFGIPNLEAMALSCPIACSDIPIFREICKDRVHYFNPYEKNSLQSTLHKILENKLPADDKVSHAKVIFEDFQFTKRAAIIINFLTK